MRLWKISKLIQVGEQVSGDVVFPSFWTDFRKRFQHLSISEPSLGFEFLPSSLVSTVECEPVLEARNGMELVKVKGSTEKEVFVFAWGFIFVTTLKGGGIYRSIPVDLLKLIVDARRGSVSVTSAVQKCLAYLREDVVETPWKVDHVLTREGELVRPVFLERRDLCDEFYYSLVVWSIVV